MLLRLFFLPLQVLVSPLALLPHLCCSKRTPPCVLLWEGLWRDGGCGWTGLLWLQSRFAANVCSVSVIYSFYFRSCLHCNLMQSLECLNPLSINNFGFHRQYMLVPGQTSVPKISSLASPPITLSMIPRYVDVNICIACVIHCDVRCCE